MRLFVTAATAVGALALCLTGCGTTQGYEGPEKPMSELANITGAHHGGTNYFSKDARWVAFTQVDEKTVGNSLIGYPENVNITGGKHLVKVIMLEKYPAGITSLPGSNGFMAEAGAMRWPSASFVLDASPSKHYIVKFIGSSPDNIPFKAWIEDENSGTVVAGAKPEGVAQ